MRLQQRQWSCGPAALVNACRSLGVRVAEGRLRSLAGTTEDAGTDEGGLIVAARGIGMTATEHKGSDGPTAWAFIRANVLDGRPCLLCIDQWQHWVAVVGITGDRVLVADSANSKKNVAELGLYSLSRTDLLKRLRHRSEQEPLYALAIGR